MKDAFESVLRKNFDWDVVNTFREEEISVLVVAVKLPTGAIEIITNTTHIQEKLDYYNNAYDENFRLKNNKEIQIIGYLLA